MEDKDKIIEMQERYIRELEQQNEAIRKALELLERELDKYNQEEQDKKELQDKQRQLLKEMMKDVPSTPPANPAPMPPSPWTYPQSPGPQSPGYSPNTNNPIWISDGSSWTCSTDSVTIAGDNGDIVMNGDADIKCHNGTLSSQFAEKFEATKTMYYGKQEDR